MSGNLAPVPPPGLWDTLVNRGATWGPTEITMTRDGIVIVPTTAVFTVYDPQDGSLLLTLNATIDGGTGLMTVPALTNVQTAAITWNYGTLLFRTTESNGNVMDLLAGNVTVQTNSD